MAASACSRPQRRAQEARSVLMAVAVGKDPSGELSQLRSAPSLSELCDSDIEEIKEGRISKKVSTIRSDLSRIKTHIKPKQLGRLKVISISQDDVEKFMH